MVSRYNTGYGGIPNQNASAPNHHNPHGMMSAMTMVRPHRPHPPPQQQQQPTSQQIQQHAANLANHASVAGMPNQNNVMKPMNHSHASALAQAAAVANMQHHNLAVAQATPPPSHPAQVPQHTPHVNSQNHSQHQQQQQVNKIAQQQQQVHNNVNANHHNNVQVPHSSYRAMHPRTDNYHASPANVAGGFANNVTGHHNPQIVRGTMPQTQQQSQVDGSQKNSQPQVYQPQQRQNPQQQYQRAPTKNLNAVNMRPTVNTQQTLSNQMIGPPGHVFIPNGPYAYPHFPSNNSMIFNQPLQFSQMTGYPRQFTPTVFYAPNINYNPTRGQTPTVAQVPVPTMTGSSIPQQSMMTNQVPTNPLQQQQQQQQQQQPQPVKIRSKAITIRNPDTLEEIEYQPTKSKNNSSVDASETASTTSTIDNDCSSETGRSTYDLPPPFIPGQALSSSVIASATDAQQLLQTTDTPVVSAKMDGPDITPKQNTNKNKKKFIETQKQAPIDAVNEVKSSQPDEVTITTTTTEEVPQPAVQETIETSSVPSLSESEYVETEIVPEPEKMSPPLPQPVPVIESALSYDAKSFEPKKQREQVQRESVERSNVDMDITQGQTIIEPTSDTNKNIITTNSSLPPSKKDETDHSISTSTISPEKIDETTTTTSTVIDNKNTLDSNIVNNNTILKVEETSFKKEKSTTPVSVAQQEEEKEEPAKEDTETKSTTTKIVDNNVVEQKKTVATTEADQINANDTPAMAPPKIPAPLHASKTAPSTLQHHQQHRKSEEAIKLDKPLKSAASRSLEKPAIQYSEDQWRPDNPEGKRKYTLDQLKVLGKTEVAKQKHILPKSLEMALTPGKSGHAGGGGGNQHRGNDIRSFSGLMPDFANKAGGGGVGTYNKRPSQQGNRGQGGSQSGGRSGSRNQEPIKRISLKMNDVQLKTVENAWRPKMLQDDDSRSKEERETDELYRKFRSTMNKLTPENFDILVNEISNAQIDTVDRLRGCIELVFEKAIAEPNYSQIYAKVCNKLSSINIPQDPDTKETKKPMTFRVMLLNQCQNEFEKHKDETSGQTVKNEEIEKETDEAKRKILMEQKEEEAYKIRQRAVGTVRFIGELYKINMLNDKIMGNCVNLLLDNGDEDSLECLCKLLTTIGKQMESKDKTLESCFKKLNEIGDKKSKVQVSSRIRFAIKDVIDLRKNRWQPRRQDLNPKTMGQIQKEQETEHRNIEIMNYPTPRKDDRRGGSMGKYSNKKQDSDGWQIATPSNNKNNRAQQHHFDLNKFKTFQQLNIGDSMKLGPSTRLGPSTGFPAPLHQNRFADLSDDTSSSGPQHGGGYSRDNQQQQYNSNKYDNFSSNNNNNNNRGNIQRQNSRENSRHRNDMNGPSRSFQANQLSRQSSASSGRDVHSQSQIIGRRSQQAEPVVAPAPAAAAATPSPDERFVFNPDIEPKDEELNKIQSLIKTLIDEYLTSMNDPKFWTEFTDDIKQKISRQHRWIAIREMHMIALDHSDNWHSAVSKMCFHCLNLRDASLLKVEEYKHAISKYFELIVDIQADYPKIFDYNAAFLGETLHANFITLADIFKYSGDIIASFSGGKMLVSILTHLQKNYGQFRVRELWAASGLQIKDFLGDDGSDEKLVADFIKDHELEYLTDSSKTAQVSNKLTDGAKIQERLSELLKTKSSSNDDQMIHEWIKVNVANTASKEFIRALTTATIEYCIENGKFNEDLFLNRVNDLLRKYIDLKEDRELEALYAVQNVCRDLEYPNGLVLQICTALSEYAVSREGFYAWRDDKSASPNDAEGKGVCMVSLKNFFLSLNEATDSEDCDEEETADPNTDA